MSLEDQTRAGGDLPNLFIAGVQKCGTTSLFDWLALQPDIYGTIEAKDYPYFSSPQNFTTQTQRFAAMFRAPAGTRHRLGADANAAYAPGGIERMHAVIPDATIILMLREPASRCLSAWRFARERGLEDRAFDTAIRAELAGESYPPDSAAGLQMNYLGHSTYGGALSELRRLYSEQQLIVLIYEEFFADPDANLAALLAQLGITAAKALPITNTNRTGSGSRSTYINRILYRRDQRGVLIRAAAGLLSPRLRATIRRKLRELNRKHDDQAASEAPVDLRPLRDYFQKDIAKVESLLDRKIPAWHRNP